MTTTPAPTATSPEIPDPDPNSRYERACRRFLEELTANMVAYIADDNGYPASWQLSDLSDDVLLAFGDEESFVRDIELQYGDPFEASDPDAAYDAHRDREVGLDD